jgi:AcrR family transcriptional regulator
MARKTVADRPYHWGEELEGELIAAAVKLVEPVGIAALSAREVARVVGVSHAAPMHYFPDRLALAAAVAGFGFERMYDAIVSALDETRDRPSEKLLAACNAYIEFGLKNRGLYRTMYAAELAERLNSLGGVVGKGTDYFANLAQLKAKVFNLFVEIVRNGQERGAFRRGRADDIARAATAASHGLAREFLDEGLGSRIDRLAHARQVIGFILTGLEPR